MGRVVEEGIVLLICISLWYFKDIDFYFEDFGECYFSGLQRNGVICYLLDFFGCYYRQIRELIVEFKRLVSGLLQKFQKQRRKFWVGDRIRGDKYQQVFRFIKIIKDLLIDQIGGSICLFGFF